MLQHLRCNSASGWKLTALMTQVVCQGGWRYNVEENGTGHRTSSKYSYKCLRPSPSDVHVFCFTTIFYLEEIFTPLKHHVGGAGNQHERRSLTSSHHEAKKKKDIKQIAVLSTLCKHGA
ncbi:uncharacterized protein [Dermacentor andersoni]|uniref:uncharacterized protein n=1 Tax=Dermacentor andersoni TaxID=34620 RepID=UPI002417A333|nr:uncharacterized protein LOC129386278 [Dermacentor andersoni]